MRFLWICLVQIVKDSGWGCEDASFWPICCEVVRSFRSGTIRCKILLARSMKLSRPYVTAYWWVVISLISWFHMATQFGASHQGGADYARLYLQITEFLVFQLGCKSRSVSKSVTEVVCEWYMCPSNYKLSHLLNALK